MALKFATVHFNFDRPGTQIGNVNFHNTVRSAGAAIQSFNANYGTADHWVRDLGMKVLNVAIDDTMVNFIVDFNLVDNSKHQGKGSMDVVVMADVEATSTAQEKAPEITIKKN